VLGQNEALTDMMALAGQNALESSGVSAEGVDLLLGYGSVSEYHTPNELSKVHQKLGLRTNCQIMPINNEFTNFNAAIQLATAMIAAGGITTALIAVGCNWTKYVSYRTPQSVSASDGAGAVIISKSDDDTKFSYVDSVAIVDAKYYGEMCMRGDHKENEASSSSQEGNYTRTSPYFHITEVGLEAYRSFGLYRPIEAANELLQKNGVASTDVALISHQSSSVLVDKWQEGIKPGQYINTVAEYANMTLATMAVNFASKYDEISKDYVVLLGVGVDFQTVATLLRRN
jgi:3-oxoacyl-[acyl-carrier-protein] synthase-3